MLLNKSLSEVSGLVLKIVDKPSQSNDKPQLLRKIKTITTQVRANFDYLIENVWFPKADICVYVETEDNQMVAYTLGGWVYPRKVAIILSTVVKEEYQNKKLSNTLNSILIKRLFFKNLLKGFYCVARTANPLVVATMTKYMKAYPSPYRSVPTIREAKIANEVAKMLSPDKEFNPDAFVVKGAFLKDGHLPKEFGNIPYYSDKINSFCDKYLQYDKKEGNAFIMVGKVNFLIIAAYFLKKNFHYFSTKNKKRKQDKFWMGYFKAYDVLNKSVAYNNLLEKIAFSANVWNKDLILDLGSGTGNLYKILKRKNVSYVGIDNCDEALNIAKGKITGDSKVSFIKCDIKGLSFKNSSFDSILSNNVLYTLSGQDMLSVLREAHRVLKDNGLFVATGMVKNFSPFMIYYDSIIQEVKTKGLFKTIVNFIKTLPQAVKVIYYNEVYIKKKNKQYSFFDSNLIKKLFNASRFRIIGIEEVYANQGLLVVAEKI